MGRSEKTRGLPQQPRAFLPAANGAHDRQFLRGARIREVQARSCPQVHGEHGASAHQEFEERLLGWAHAQVAHDLFTRAASSPTTCGSKGLSRFAILRTWETSSTLTREAFSARTDLRKKQTLHHLNMARPTGVARRVRSITELVRPSKKFVGSAVLHDGRDDLSR